MNVIEPRQDTDQARREEWLQQRLEHVTATDAARIITGKGFDVYLDKKQLTGQKESPEHFFWGHKLQIPILEGYADRVGKAIIHADPWAIEVHPEAPLFSASLDARWRDDDQRPVDAKNIGVLDSSIWGDEWGSLIPDYYMIQLQLQMAVTSTPAADLAVLFGGRKLRVYQAERDDGIIADVMTYCDEWWQKHIVEGVQPAVDGSDSYTSFLARTKQTSDLIVDAGPAELEWIARLREARATKQAAEAVESEAANHLKTAIGEHGGIQAPGFRATFKKAKDSSVLDKDALIDELEAQLVARAYPRSDLLNLRNSLTSIRPGSRSFRPTWKDQ